MTQKKRKMNVPDWETDRDEAREFDWILGGKEVRKGKYTIKEEEDLLAHSLFGWCVANFLKIWKNHSCSIYWDERHKCYHIMLVQRFTTHFEWLEFSPFFVHFCKVFSYRAFVNTHVRRCLNERRKNNNENYPISFSLFLHSFSLPFAHFFLGRQYQKNGTQFRSKMSKSNVPMKKKRRKLKRARRWNNKWEIFLLNLECAFWKFIFRQWTSHKHTHNTRRLGMAQTMSTNSNKTSNSITTTTIAASYRMLDDDTPHIPHTEHMTNSKYWSNKNIKREKVIFLLSL